MSARTVARRILVKLGILKPQPYTCKLCGYVVPLVGARHWQASVAYLHFETKHWDIERAPKSPPTSEATQ